jgi:hypothetical protein
MSLSIVGQTASSRPASDVLRNESCARRSKTARRCGLGAIGIRRAPSQPCRLSKRGRERWTGRSTGFRINQLLLEPSAWRANWKDASPQNGLAEALILDCKNLLLVLLPKSRSDAGYISDLRAYESDFRSLDTECVIARDDTPWLRGPAVLLADRWGEVIHITAAVRVRAISGGRRSAAVAPIYPESVPRVRR